MAEQSQRPDASISPFDRLPNETLEDIFKFTMPPPRSWPDYRCCSAYNVSEATKIIRVCRRFNSVACKVTYHAIGFTNRPGDEMYINRNFHPIYRPSELGNLVETLNNKPELRQWCRKLMLRLELKEDPDEDEPTAEEYSTAMVEPLVQLCSVLPDMTRLEMFEAQNHHAQVLQSQAWGQFFSCLATKTKLRHVGFVMSKLDILPKVLASVPNVERLDLTDAEFDNEENPEINHGSVSCCNILFDLHQGCADAGRTCRKQISQSWSCAGFPSLPRFCVRFSMTPSTR